MDIISILWSVYVSCLFYAMGKSDANSGVLSYPLHPTSVMLHNSPLHCNSNRSSDISVLAPNDSTSIDQAPPPKLVLTGFFPIGNFTESQFMATTTSLIPAVIMALDEINNSSDILHGYHLTLDVRDTLCDSTHAITEFADSIAMRLTGSPPPNSLNVGVIGPHCAPVIEAVSGVISRSLNLPVLSYGLNLPVQKHNKFPTSFHISRSILRTVKSAIGIMRHFNWTSNIAFVSEEGSNFFHTTTERVLKSNVDDNFFLIDGSGRKPIPVSLFVEIHSTIANSVLSFVDELRERKIRVILGFISQRVAAQLICSARLGVLPGNGFVYVLSGSYTEDWWKVENEFCNLTNADVESVILVSGKVIDPDSSTVLLSGRTIHDFRMEYRQRLSEWCGELHFLTADVYAGSLYDAVWAFALALNESVDFLGSSLEHGVQYDQITLQSIVKALGSVNFTGVTGKVKFDEERGQTGAADLVQQIQNGSTVIVGRYLNGKLGIFDSPGFVWNGSSRDIPDDAIAIIYASTNIYLLVIVSFFTFCGIVFGIFMCLFNCYYSQHKILLASSPRLNYLIILGVLCGYITIVVRTLLESPLATKINENVFMTLCLIRIWMLPLSFTLAYGILFVKAWRIYRIFHNPWSSTRMFYKDYQLMLIVLVATAIDVVILIPWTIFDPYRQFLIPENVDYNAFSQRIHFSCSSTNSFAWIVALGVYKIVFILAGILIISLVRKEVIERKIFDDTKSTAAAVYITSGAAILGLPLTLLFILVSPEQVGLSYLTSAIWVNISCYGTLACVFTPKVYSIMIKKESGNKVDAANYEKF